MRQDSKFSAGIADTNKKPGAAQSPELATPEMGGQQPMGAMHTSEHYQGEEERDRREEVKRKYQGLSIVEDAESNGHSMSHMGATVEMGASGNPLNSRMVQDFQRNQEVRIPGG
mmetsp:Transcript_19051/g.25780  ORF Transcript_19051/g.25780 Transcript_19051/m.25780 type:complete len:114 (-) Transcript_19051:2371-2712(-)